MSAELVVIGSVETIYQAIKGGTHAEQGTEATMTVTQPLRDEHEGLIPHAEAEDRALYPVVEKLMGTSGVTATMSRDHVEVGRLTEELAGLRTQLAVGTGGEVQVKALRRVLYGLYALVKVHFGKRTLLDGRLAPAAADEMFEAMEAAAKTAKARQRAEAETARI